MAYEITNFEQLESVLNEKVREALELASDHAISVLMDIIHEDVYNTSEGWYKRTHDFEQRENWEARVYKGLRGYTLSINFNEDGFSHNVRELQHTNSNDNRIEPMQLLGLLNDPSGLDLSTNLSLWGIDHDPFWIEFESWFKNNFTNVFKGYLEGLRN